MSSSTPAQLEADPSLGKILRNIKLAVASLHNFDEVEWFGEPYLIPSLSETLEHLPALEQEDLERNLMSMTTGNENVPVLYEETTQTMLGDIT